MIINLNFVITITILIVAWAAWGIYKSMTKANKDKEQLAEIRRRLAEKEKAEKKAAETKAAEKSSSVETTED